MNFSKATVIGRITGELKNKTTNDGSHITSFDIQTGSNDIIQCNCWANLALAVQEQIKPNSLVFISGTLIINTTPPANGEKYGKKTFAITVRDINCIEGSVTNIDTSNITTQNVLNQSPDADDESPF